MREAEPTVNASSFCDHPHPTNPPDNKDSKSLLGVLRNTDQRMASYVWRAWLISVIPALVIAEIATLALFMLGYDNDSPDISLKFLLVGGVCFAPWAETLMMWPILAILKLVLQRTVAVGLASAVIWGALHSQISLQSAFATTWSFFVFSLCFLEWEKKSRGKAITSTALVHTCQNGLVFAVMLISVLSGVDSLPDKNIRPTPPAQHNAAPISAEKENPSAVSSVPATRSGENTELSNEEKRKRFQLVFPEFGIEEYVLAEEDLYPYWKKNGPRVGTWAEFLLVYIEFVQWWNDRGSPPEHGLDLWKDFLAHRK